MHVAVDATAVVPGYKGLGRFQARLLEEMARQVPGDVAGTVLAQPGFAELAVERPGHWSVETLTRRRSVARELVETPRVLRRLRPDVYLTTTDRLRAPRGMPVVLYVFEDPVHRGRMQASNPATPRRQVWADRAATSLFGRTVRAAAHVLAASETTARDLVERHGVPDERITVAMPGPFHEPRQWAGPSDEDPRVLAFVDRDVRDNGAGVLRAFQHLGAPWRLEVVGDAPDWMAQLADDLELGDRVDFRGRIGDEALRSAYATSQIYLDLSLFEGFGAQAVEAARAGVPSVVASNSALPQVTQHRAVYVDPEDDARVVQELRRLADSPEERGRAGAAFDQDELAGRWQRLVETVLDRCRAAAGG